MNDYDSTAYQLGALDQPVGFRLDGLADRIASVLHFTDTSVFRAGSIEASYRDGFEKAAAIALAWADGDPDA